MTIAAGSDDNRQRRAALLLLACLAVLALQILVLHLMGRLWICECGYIKLWEGVAKSSGNSQHVSDWYTPSHIIHGFLFYGLGHLLMRGKPLSGRLLLATVIESAWEILENTPMVMNRYRSATISLDYFGDSILNSTMDTLAMATGFLIASRLPVAVTVAIAIALELFTGFMVRDNLTLNVLMLVWPMDAVKAWQAG
ncbi:DUF2585 domain-containing protein [Sinorhizobium medicae]|uniref:DUF2585 domain-containing protein n=1 Tax=Sinorhizobium medicae TaxID=110321 RepID=UPI00035FBE75|nr:DUF2585 domain-containing protein [Sinorhizobium medicae]WQO45363.1 DUF2585 domain-containing protein [Sinorhizobium medicae]WQO65527.1 DUF2585 domain-containing protein [Sinorhizobium medicae]WQO72652.1 DUF2585 domain-containing protein [Sinorhizobium medicae]WQO91963.1 DUF2585 domain-containing protein [Sinorhizobium medicae]